MAKKKISKTGTSCVRIAQVALNQGQFNEMIRKKAEEIYEKSGRKPGHDLDNWLEAERIVKQLQG